MGRMEDPTFATQIHEVHCEVAIYKLWHKGIQDYRYCKINKMAASKRGLSSQNMVKLANLEIGHPPDIYS